MRSDNIFQKVSDKKWPLSRNENLTEFGSRYPDYSELHEFLETKFDIPRQYICLTSGAEEAIRICLSSPNYPNRLNFIPTWGLVSIFNNLYGTEKVKELHLKQDLSYNISKLKKHIENNQIVYLANPNNVGSFTTASELIELIKRFNKTIFIIDETYAEFYFYESLIRFVPIYKNLIVVKSFSKAFGLASKRAGFYATKHKHFIDLRPANPISDETIESVIKSFDTVDLAVDLLKKGKKYISKEIKSEFSVLKTKGNFIVFKYSDILEMRLRRISDYQVFSIKKQKYIKITALPIDLAVEFIKDLQSE